MRVLAIYFLLIFSDKVAPYCGYSAADIVFILDSSGSVGSKNFEKTKEFFKAMVDGFQIGSKTVRIGAVPFSTVVHNTFQLTSFYSKSALKSHISDIPYESGGTNTADAIEYARTTSFGSYGRNDTSKIAVIITDGKSNDKSNTLSEAQLLRNNGVIIFSVGVGGGVDTSELQGMATKTSYVFDVSTFSTLNSIRDKLARTTCEVITTCDYPGTPNNGKLHGSDFSQGESVTYSCETGYKLDGNQKRTCQSGKVWSGSLPSCISDTSCGNPGTPSNGHLHGSDFSKGDTVTYSCEIGYQLLGDQQRTCQRDPRNIHVVWSGTLPSCMSVTAPCRPKTFCHRSIYHKLIRNNMHVSESTVGICFRSVKNATLRVRRHFIKYKGIHRKNRVK